MGELLSKDSSPVHTLLPRYLTFEDAILCGITGGEHCSALRGLRDSSYYRGRATHPYYPSGLFPLRGCLEKGRRARFSPRAFCPRYHAFLPSTIRLSQLGLPSHWTVDVPVQAPPGAWHFYFILMDPNTEYGVCSTMSSSCRANQRGANSSRPNTLT